MLNFLFLHPLIHTQMLTIYLIRHGETIENCSGILQGCTPGHLNKKGEEQIKALSDRLGGLKFDAFVSSDLKRALDSAAIINKKFNLPICVHYCVKGIGVLLPVCHTRKQRN